MARGARTARKLTYAALFLAVVSVAFGHTTPHVAPDSPTGDGVVEEPPAKEPPEVKEADKVYMQALRGIRFLSAIPPSQAGAYYPEPTLQPSPVILALFPNQNGLIPSLVHAINRVRTQPWLPAWLSRRFGGRTGRRKEDVRLRAQKIVEWLQRAIELGHEDAMYTLAEISLFPPTAMPLNVSRAFHHYSQHAELTGNATSQSMMGFFYATGYGGVVDVDQSQSLLHYSFAALTGSQRAEMVMGYRHWAGIGVNEDCMAALGWYESAAEKAMHAFYDGPPGGRTLPPTFTRLSDVDGGVYGPGASVASTGANSIRPVMKAANSKAVGETWEDVLEYYQYHADRGEIDFSYRLGKIYYHGSVYASSGGAASGAEGVGSIGRDFHRARAYFVSITRHVWPSNNVRYPLANKKDVEDRVGQAAAMAAGYLGRMYLRGEGVKQDARVAKMWFERGVEYADRECQNGLGIIWRDGLIDGKIDLAKAMTLFTDAAGQDLAEAQVQLGKHYYELGDYAKATTFFNSAIQHGSPFEAYYYIAEMHSNTAHNPHSDPSIRGGSCGIAVSFYKLVAERGTWEDNLVGHAEELWDLNGVRTGGRGVAGSHVVASSSGPSYIVRDAEREISKLKWAIAAEAGFEVAQNNLAYLMDQDRSALTRYLGAVGHNDTARLALTQWIRSASQRNVDALVKVGDYYYHGLGVSEEPEEVRWEKAAGYYHRAVETQVSALAMWNLGWMYENGRGVAQDFILAKRYYDLALETNFEAYLPVTLSLIRLYARSFWYALRGGTEKNLIIWGGDDQVDGEWYLGRVASELKNKLTDQPQTLVDPDDPLNYDSNNPNYDDDTDSVQWARDRKREELERAQAEHDADGGFGPEDYFDAAMGRPGSRGENFDHDDTLDDLIFMAVLCGILGLLIYMRTRWVRQADQEPLEQQQEQPQEPQPVHPDVPPL